MIYRDRETKLCIYFLTKQLFSFYIKAEYELESPDKDDATQAIKNANKIIKVIKEMMQDIF